MAEEKQETAEGEVILALCYNASTLGVAAYDEENSRIYCDTLSSNKDDIEEVLSTLKIALKPTLLILHPSIVSNLSFLEACIADPLDPESIIYRYQALKSSCWNVEQCKNLICDKLVIKSNVEHQRAVQNHYSFLASKLDFNSPQLCSALGALLVQLQSTYFALDDGRVTVSALDPLPSLNFLRLDAESMRALSIFVTDLHPNVLAGKGRTKEGFSLFTLLDRTRSAPGRQRLKDWMMKPCTDIGRIAQRQESIAFAMDSSSLELVTESAKLLKKWCDVPKLLLRVRKAEARPEDWCRLYVSLQCGIPIAQGLADTFSRAMAAHAANVNDPRNAATIPDKLSFFPALMQYVDISLLRDIFEQLVLAFDCSATLRESEIVIRAGFDPELDRLRAIYDSLEDHLSAAAREVLQYHPKLHSVSVEYVPQVGFLLALPMEDAHLLSQIVGGAQDGWGQHRYSQYPQGTPPPSESSTTLIYTDNGKHFYKCPCVERLDLRLGDVKSDLTDRQRKLMLVLEEMIVDNEAAIQRLNECLSSWDVVISLASVSKERRFTRPEICNQRIVVVKSGRHALQELVVESFIANDTFIDGSRNVGLVTGPNSSGKSVYLKQVGLIVYLAMLGMYVPAEKAVVGVFDRILTRICTVESQSNPQSAFAQDCSQISRLIARSGSRSLCLVDEFGKGTAPSDGISLLAAVVAHVAGAGMGQERAPRPLALFALHFTEIFHPRIHTPNIKASSVAYRMMTIRRGKSTTGNNGGDDESADDEVDEVTPLFRLEVGIAPDSEGIACAGRAGLQPELIERAKELKMKVQARQPIPAAHSVLTSRQQALVDNRYRGLLRLFLESTANDWATAEATKLAEMRAAVNF